MYYSENPKTTCNEKDPFSCFIDFSKAFPSVDHTKLFNKLLSCQLEYVVICTGQLKQHTQNYKQLYDLMINSLTG